MILSRERVNLSALAPSLSREEIAFISRKNQVSEKQPFWISDETTKSLPKFNPTGRILVINLNSSSEEQNPGTYLKKCITALTDYLVDYVPGRDLVGLRIRNPENVEDKMFGNSLRRCYRLKSDVSAVLVKVIHSNVRFGLSDCLEVHLVHLRMPVGDSETAEKT